MNYSWGSLWLVEPLVNSLIKRIIAYFKPRWLHSFVCPVDLYGKAHDNYQEGNQYPEQDIHDR